MKRKKTTKKKKLAERVAYNLRFSLIRLNYKAKMQLYEAKQAKRVVTEPINTPRTKKINGSFFGFRNLGEGLCASWALPLVECVAVWALKLPVVSAPLRSLHNRSPPDFLQLIPTHSKPTRHKALLLDYGNRRNCH